ncbi:hypothetical protein [Pseudophaeobacter arcticus]|uniref:hypothetical protein n=1 Tax=Pseudophaeobacter arcticus TaxID=385492 RepID=UPI002492A6BA|nr:hypothetical protein [Pseudophaeobacter arcticus]
MKTAEKIDDYTLCIHLKAALLDSVLTPQPDMDVPDTHLGIAFAIPIDPPSGRHFHPRSTAASDRCKMTTPVRQFTSHGRMKRHLHDPHSAMPSNEPA